MRPIHTPFRTFVFIFMVSAGAWGRERTQLQFEGVGAYSLREPVPYAYPNSGSGYQLSTNLSSICFFSDDLWLIIDQRMTGTENDAIFPERRYRSDNYIYGGIGFQGKGAWQAGLSTDLFSNAQPLPAPYIPASMMMAPDMLCAADASWTIETDRIHAAVATTWFRLDYNLKPRNPFTDPLLADSIPYGARHDVDLWSDFEAGVILGDAFSFDAGGRFKSDLSDDRDYDIFHYWGGIAGEHRFIRNRFCFDWNVRERFLQGAVMKGNGYSVGPATEFSSRLLWRMQSKFFIRGSSKIQIGNRLAKQRYEVQLRKTWSGGSSVDIGYFGTHGVLFPRQGTRIGTTLRLLDHFGIFSEIDLYYMRFAMEKKPRFYRADADIEFFFPLRERFECFIGGGYRLYDRHPLFSSRTTFFSGIRTW